MAKSKQAKTTEVENLAHKFGRMQSAVFVNFTGLKVKDAQKLREQTWEANVEYTVAKKTILDIACKKAGLAVSPREFEGNIGVAMGFEDPLTAIKLLAEFGKGNEALKIVGGIFEGRFIASAEVLTLSKLPGRQELLGQLVGTLAAPMQRFARIFSDVPGQFVRVLQGMSQKSTAV